MFIIRNRKIFLSIAVAVVIISIALLGVWGLNLGIDFTGGAITEIRYPERPDNSVLRSEIDNLSIGSYTLQTAGDDSVVVRTKFLGEEERNVLNERLTSKWEGSEITRFNAIGPTISKELTEKALIAIIFVIVVTVLFIAFVFRHVSEPVSSWKYGLVAIAALVHDILLPAGIFAILGKFFGIEIDILFVMALLSILGISINDTIVVFDRIRENLKVNKETSKHEDFKDTVGRSLSETFTRSLNTSVTTLLVLFSLFFLGPDSTKYFVLALILGMIAGTYSSLFIASPLLVLINERAQKKASK